MTSRRDDEGYVSVPIKDQLARYGGLRRRLHGLDGAITFVEALRQHRGQCKENLRASAGGADEDYWADRIKELDRLAAQEGFDPRSPELPGMRA